MRAQDSSAERMREMCGELANDVIYAAHPVAARIWSVIFSYYLASLICQLEQKHHGKDQGIFSLATNL